MAATLDVKTGFWGTWIDYDRPFFQRQLFTLSNRDAGIWTNFIAVILTLATPLVFVLFQRLIEVIWTWVEQYHQSRTETRLRKQREAQPTESSRLLANSASGDTVGTITASTEPVKNLNGHTSTNQDTGSGDLGTAVSENERISKSEPATDPPTTTNSNGSSHYSIESEASSSKKASKAVEDDVVAHSQVASNASSHYDLEAGVANQPLSEYRTDPTEVTSECGSRNDSKSLVKNFMSKKTPQAAAAKLVKIAIKAMRSPNAGTQHRDYKKFLICIVLSFFCAALFSLLTYATIMSAQIASDPIVLSNSDSCGVRIVDPRIPLSPFNYMREVESGDIAKRCYGKSKAVEECNNFFMEPSFPIMEIHNTTCPFADGFCLEGNFAAYTLNTGMISSQSLGINVPIGYAFKRTTTCAPVKRIGYVGLDDSMRFIEYYYGPHAGLTERNLTWLTPLYRTLSDSGYTVDPFCSVHSTDQGWQPREELHTDDGSTLTLLLVSSKKNFHQERRNDPIFPAKHSYLIGGDIMYANDDPIATVLACTDRTAICDASGVACWDPIYDPPPQHNLPGRKEIDGYFMLQVALLRSRLCHSIKYRGGNALDAQTKINIYTSLPLATEQWKVEARNLFAASLARVQIDLRDYARGSAAKEPGFTDYMPPEFKGMCVMYKFRGLGYTNLSVWPFTFLLLGSVVVFAMSFKGDVETNINGRTVTNRRFLAEILFVKLYGGCRFILKKLRALGNAMKKAPGKVMALLRNGRPERE